MRDDRVPGGVAIADAQAAAAKAAYDASHFTESLAAVQAVIAAVAANGPELAAGYLFPYLDTWLAAATAAHPHDVPNQLAAARNAWEVCLFLSEAQITDGSRAELAPRALSVAGYLSFGSPTSDLAVTAFTLARTLYAGLTDRDHRLDIAACWTTQSLRHHEISGHPACPDPAAERSKQRAAAAEASALIFPIVEGFPDPTLGQADVQRIAHFLGLLIGMLTFGSPDSAPSVLAADLRRQVYQAMTDRDHRLDIADTWTSLARRHHETSAQPACPDRAAEWRSQRLVAARAAELLFAIAEPPATSTLSGTDLTRAADLLRRLTGLLAFGAPESEAPNALALVQHAEALRDQILALVDQVADAVTAAQTALARDEELAGIRPAGFTGPVDYEQLGALVPNEFWAPPHLVTSLRDLAYAYQHAGRTVDTVMATSRRVMAYRRMAEADPATHRAGLGTALILNSRFLQISGAKAEAVAPAEEAVLLQEEMAGIRPVGSTEPLNYSHLAGFSPNADWVPPFLLDGLENLAYSYQRNDQPLDALAIMGNRLEACARLVAEDVTTTQHQPELTSARDGEQVFWRNAGMPPSPSTDTLPPEPPHYMVTGPVAALSRNSHQIDLFAVGPDGGVHSAWWDGDPWRDWFRIGSGAFGTTTPISTLSRNSDQMDIFAVGLDGRVWTAWWHGNPWTEWSRTGSRTFSQNTPIAVLSRNSDQMDLFAVGEDGGVYNAWWNGDPWREWRRIGTAVFAQKTPITALSRNSDQMDLFAVGEDGSLWSAWWDGEWHDWFRIDGQTFAQGTPIAALSRNSDQMDIFAVGLDGNVWSTWWHGNPWQEWFRIDGQTFAQGTPIAALSRNSDQMDIFAVGLDGNVWSTWWHGNPWQEWFQVGNSHFDELTSIAGLARDADHMDLFAVGRDGRVDTATWSGNPWRGWLPISILRPRPFYVVGHNPNSLSEARDYLEAGANALEPDVQTYPSSPLLCISHGPGGGDAPMLEVYLKGLHALAREFPQLALIVFDCKQPVTSPEHGLELLTSIRDNLTYDNNLNIIISIASRDDDQDAFFDLIAGQLRPREGLMIDNESDPEAISNYFTSRGVTNQGYGNGISPMNRLIGPYYRYSLESACALRAGSGQPKFIYVWTSNTEDGMREYIRVGVDGIITDNTNELRGIISEPESSAQVRLATRDDNPFQPDNRAYALMIHTSDIWLAGTDANVTFTLAGSLGTMSKTVNTDRILRMKQGGWNYVTIQSEDLGRLTSLSVKRDDQGYFADWHLDRVLIFSGRYRTRAKAVFDRWIDTTSTYTVDL